MIKPFNLNDRKVVVDIVCDRGLTWVKVVARNPKSIKQICMGDTNYGVRSIIDQAEEFLECAHLYPCLFQIPKVFIMCFIQLRFKKKFFRLNLYLLMVLEIN